MVKLLVFAILLAVSPANGLIETLFRAENTCYLGCHKNYAASTAHLDACRKGCDYEFHKEKCADRCRETLTDDQTRASCQVGCTLSHSADKVEPEKPIIAVDPVPVNKIPEVVPVNPELERPRSIILIRLRQRPPFEMPSMQRFFNTDPMQMFNDMIKQLQEGSNDLGQSIRQSLEKNPNELPTVHKFGPVSELVKNIPIMRLPANIRADSSSESSEEGDKRPLIDEFKHVIKHPREHQQYLRERMQPITNRFQQFFTDVHAKWNDLVRRQPKIPIWIFLGILISSSAILWYMVMSLCRHTPSRRALSVRAQELVFHPYEYDAYEKEKIQPDDHPYEVTESLPIKVKLSNI
jgi:hypothetical protein